MVWCARYTFPKEPTAISFLNTSVCAAVRDTFSDNCSKLIISDHGKFVCEETLGNFVISARQLHGHSQWMLAETTYLSIFVALSGAVVICRHGSAGCVYCRGING